TQRALCNPHGRDGTRPSKEPAPSAFRWGSRDKPERRSVLGMSSPITTRRALCHPLVQSRNAALQGTVTFLVSPAIQRKGAALLSPGNVEFHLDTASSLPTPMAEMELGPPRNRHFLRFAGGRVISRSAAHFGNVEFHLDTASSAQPTWPRWNSALHGAAGSGFCLLPCALLVGRQQSPRQHLALARLLPLTSAGLCGKVRDLIYTLINRFSEEQDGGQLTSSQETRQAGREAPQSQCKPALHGSYLHQERCKS